MSQTYTGYLDATDMKSGKSKSGRAWTMYKGAVGGKWVSFGFDQPKVAKGDYVEIVTEMENDFEVVKSARKIDPPAAGTASSAHGPVVTVPYIDKRQASIVYQSSRKDALEFVNLLIAQDALPVSSAKTSAGKAKRYEEILALVDKLTVQFFYDVETLRNLDRVVDAGAEGPAPASLPEDAQPEEEEKTVTEPDGNW